MPQPFLQIHADKKGELKKEFDRSNPEYWAKLQGRPRDHDRVNEIIDHTNDARRILDENFKEERQDRVAKQAVEVWNERARQYEYLTPRVRAHLIAENSILAEARKRVVEQHDKELAILQENENEAIKRIANGDHHQSQSNIEKEIENMTDQEKQTHFKAEIHKLIDDSNKARFQVSKIINNERERMLDEAKENGSEDPIGDVKSVTSSMYKGVQEKLHGDIHAVFLKHGYDPDRQQVEFYANGEDLGEDSEQSVHDQNTESEQDIGLDNDAENQPPKPNQDDDQSQ